MRADWFARQIRTLADAAQQNGMHPPYAVGISESMYKEFTEAIHDALDGKPSGLYENEIGKLGQVHVTLGVPELREPAPPPTPARASHHIR